MMRQLIYTIFMFSMFSFLGCSNAPGENDVTIAQLQEKMQHPDCRLLDIRTPKEIASGKISAEAYEADFYAKGFIEDVQQKISKSDTVYVYCRGGNRSAKAVKQLRELGYENVYNVMGGIKKWTSEGNEVE